MDETQLLASAQQMRKLICSRQQISRVPVVKTAQLFTQGNFTTVLLNGKYAGMSKRNPTDNDSSVGIQLATRRAVEQLVNH